MSIRVLVVDPHRIVREGLRHCLEAPDITVVGGAATGAEAVVAAVQLRPDVVVLEARLPDMPGPQVCAAIAYRVPDAAIAFFAGDTDPQLAAAAAAAGASAYLPKDSEELDLADAVRRVAAGEELLDCEAAPRSGSESRPRLSNQELKVLRLAAAGLTNREIGTRLYLSRHTVKEYLSNAMRKLGVDSRIEAVVEASRRGLLEPQPLSRAS